MRISSSLAETGFDPLRTGEVLIFDTGPLRELVLFYAVDQLHFESLRQELKFFVDRRTYDNCVEFISLFKTKITTAAVVAEIGNWIRKGPGGRGIDLWKRVYYEFRNMGMDERLVKLLEMDMNAVARYGAADVSLLTLASRTLTKKSVILTVDRKLAGECQNARIGCVLLSEFQL